MLAAAARGVSRLAGRTRICRETREERGRGEKGEGREEKRKGRRKEERPAGLSLRAAGDGRTRTCTPPATRAGPAGGSGESRVRQLTGEQTARRRG
jgi:hypothetical protein